MSDTLQQAIRDEVVAEGTKLGGKAAEKVMDWAITITGGRFGRKKRIVRFTSGMLFRFQGDPLYDDVVVGFQKTLAKYRVPSSNEQFAFNGKEYLHALAVRQKTDPITPFLTGEEPLTMDQMLTAMVHASSAVLYLRPILPDEVSSDQLKSAMRDTMELFDKLKVELEDQISIRHPINFCKVTVGTVQAHMMVEKLRSSLPSMNSVPEGDDERSITVQLNDSSVVEALIEALEKSL